MPNQSDPEAPSIEGGTALPAPLQLLLFVDSRSSAQTRVRQNIQSYLASLQKEYHFDLQTIEIEQQPHLVEHLRLVATPALVKIAPEPRHTLAGSNLVAQLEQFWPQWRRSAQDRQAELDRSGVPAAQVNSVSHAAELMRLSDEIFQLKQEKEELADQLRFKDRVLAMLAHDLRNPLTAASIAVETLELSYRKQAPEQLAAMRQQIYQQAQAQFRQMNRMISDILQTAKGGSAELHLQPQRVYLPPLGEEAIAQFEDALASKKLTLAKDLPQDLPPAYADRELLRQVLVNLLDNAVKYTPEGGQITIAGLHRTTQKLQISISDTGPGIPEAKREHIFEGHVRLERDAETDGYGLGLALCRQVVRAHYGHIWVDSECDRGSSFHFTLPVYQD